MADEAPISRDELFALAALPIGGEAARAAVRNLRPGEKAPDVVKQAAKRAAKIWLPLGRKGPVGRGGPSDAQIDLEDAVEAAGGKRGRLA